MSGASYLAYRRFEDVFDALAQGTADKAVVPYVNSLAGPVTMSCALLARRPVRVLDEVMLRISHALIALPGTATSELRYVLSHPVALRQCRQFFRQHPHLVMVAMDDTAGSVAYITARGKRHSAAIAGGHCAALYGAQVLVDAIEDSPENYTQFLLIEPCRSAGARGSGLEFDARFERPPARRA